jgi:hypothetical protein
LDFLLFNAADIIIMTIEVKTIGVKIYDQFIFQSYIIFNFIWHLWFKKSYLIREMHVRDIISSQDILIDI